MMDFSHFKNMPFLLFALSNFLLYTWYDVPYVYIADLATMKGYSEEDASYLISLIGILNMFGEVNAIINITLSIYAYYICVLDTVRLGWRQSLG